MYTFLLLISILRFSPGHSNFFFETTPFRELKKAMAPSYEITQKYTIKNTKVLFFSFLS